MGGDPKDTAKCYVAALRKRNERSGYSRREIRALVMERDGGRCTVCGREAAGVVPVNPVGRTDWKARGSLRASCMLADCRPNRLCGKYIGDSDGTCPQLTCNRRAEHEGLCDNVRGDE